MVHDESKAQALGQVAQNNTATAQRCELAFGHMRCQLSEPVSEALEAFHGGRLHSEALELVELVALCLLCPIELGQYVDHSVKRHISLVLKLP